MRKTHKESHMATIRFIKNYVESGLSELDFWDSLDEQEKEFCRRQVMTQFSRASEILIND